jgi:hypothetical protein
VTWWESVLATLAVIGFWVVWAFGGSWVDRRFQRWQDARLQDGVEQMRQERLAREAAVRRG